MPDLSKKNKFGEILVKVNGKLTNIVDLEKPDYEEFLERMQALIAAYTAINRRTKDANRNWI